MTSSRALFCRLTFLALVLLSIAGPSVAQDADARAREALRRLQQQLQSVLRDKAQLEAERAKLEQEKAALEEEAAAAAKQAHRARSGERRLRRELGGEVEQLPKDLAEQRKRGDDLQARLSALIKRQEQTADALDKETESGKRLSGIVTQQREIIGRQAGMVQACDAKNLKLDELNRSILKAYRDKGMLDALLQKEPFTSIKDVQMQNILQEYKQKLDAQRVEKAELQPVR